MIRQPGPAGLQVRSRWSSVDEERKETNPRNYDWFQDPSDPETDELALQGETTKEGIVQHVVIKDSENVEVDLTSIQAAVNLQAALQLAIRLVLSIVIAGSDSTEAVSANLIQSVYTKQKTVAKIRVEESKDVHVVFTSAEASLNIQILLQVLLALVAKLEVL